MKKRRWAVYAVLALMLWAAAAGAETVVKPPFLPAIGQEAKLQWFRHSHAVYRYAFSLPGEFMPMDGNKGMEEVLAKQAPGDPDYLYEAQQWMSMDGRRFFQFQLKKPSFASLEEEISNLPDSLRQMIERKTQQGAENVRATHGKTIVHQLPAGPMLEVALQYELPVENAQPLSVHSIYLDYYDANNEYIFLLEGMNTTYDELLPVLLKIGESISITPIVLRVP